MKKTVILAFSLLFTCLCSACYIRALDSSRNYRYHLPEPETTYEQMLSSSRDLKDLWDIGENWMILMDGMIGDPITNSEVTYIQVMDDLEEILKDKTLYGLMQPEGVRNYNKYAEDLLDGPSSNYKLWANFSAGVIRTIADDEVYLHNLRIILPDITRCYVIVDYGAHVGVIQKRYAYYTEDSQVIEELIEWAKEYATAEEDPM